MNKLTNILICAAFILFVIQSKAQKQDNAKIYKNNINIELLGKGILYSIEYERMIWEKQRSQFLVSAGIDPYWEGCPEFSSYYTNVMIPFFAINYTYGNKWKLFVSEAFSFSIPLKASQIPTFGGTYISSKITAHYYYWFNSIGTTHNLDRHFFLRLYGTIVYTYNKHYDTTGDRQNISPAHYYYPYLGLDFGYRF